MANVRSGRHAGAMKKTLLNLFSAMALTTLAACSGADAASSAAGIYELDKAAMKEAMMAMMPAEAKGNAQAVEMAGKMVDGMIVTIELKADGTSKMDSKMEMMGQTQEHSAAGTWKLEGGKLTIDTKDDAGKSETKTVDYKDGMFMVEQEQGGQKIKMTFRRKK